MFDAGLFEMLVIFTIGLLVLGPERLPRVAKFIGRWVGQARRAVTKLNNEIERELALEEIRRIQRESEENLRREEARLREEITGKPAGPSAASEGAEASSAPRAAGTPDAGEAGPDDGAPASGPGAESSRGHANGTEARGGGGAVTAEESPHPGADAGSEDDRNAARH